MFRTKAFLLVFFAMFSCLTYGQRYTANINNFKESLGLLKKGIYLTIDDFFNNKHQSSINLN